MPSGKMRCTRRLRSWMVDQVSSGKYRGLVWDDDEKTMFRIPWKHAAKHDFRCDEDAAIFKAWAEFKGKLSENEPAGPASWKTRLRCALNKSPEFSEVTERSQLDISEPYKVYRLVPLDEQGLTEVKKEEEKDVRRSKCKKRRSNSEISEESPKNKIKMEEAAAAVQSITRELDVTTEANITFHPDEPTECADMMKKDEVIDEIQLNLTVETTPPPGTARELEQFNNEGKEPESEITLCFGEELLEDDDISKKLIIIKISLPWAEKQKEMQAWAQSMSLLQSLAQQSPSGEITLNLVELPAQTFDML
ncbi:interferon regulatory factor 9 isoform X2 [Tachysurus vachellii]|uniref:interferon regulatory factor 9 isoform X2 n=1 Tax=Tachysurus vachellii TaxID=175792 RepID=UPI00296B2D46|nr:interferon regulatory factor 9 isoform X2 [Tachysurus vachellii]